MIEFINSGTKSREFEFNEQISSSPLILKEEIKKLPKPKISDFDIGEVIGIGNFGKVFKAINKLSNRICALKVLKKESVA